MAYAFNGTTQYLLSSDSPIPNAEPISMACWFYPNDTGLNNFLMAAAFDSGANPHYLGIRNNASKVGLSRRGAAFTEAFTTTTYTTGQWSHAAAVFSSTTSRTAYLNGGGSVTNTTTNTPSGTLAGVSIGALTRSSTSLFINANIAEAAIWTAALTADDIRSLSRGASPALVRPGSLAFYAPLIRDLQDVRGGLAITNNNGATVQGHPRIFY